MFKFPFIVTFIVLINLFFAFAQDECISVFDCPKALEFIYNRANNVDPKTDAFVKSVRCNEDPVDIKVYCNRLIDTETNNNLQCITPNGKKGICKKLDDCPALSSRKTDLHADKFLARSKCSKNEDDVCCGNDVDFSHLCGTVKSTPKISRGQFTKKYQHPWMAILVYNTYEKDETICGGSLINCQFVLTAAHCVRSTLTSVRVGVHTNNVTTNSSLYKVIDRIKHPMYISGARNYDIALLKITEVPFTDEIKWICLPKNDFIPQHFSIVGYGENELTTLRHVAQVEATNVTLLSNLDCDRYYPADNLNYSIILCVGSANGSDACQGDSGGPLLSPGAHAFWTLYGVISGGYECTLGYPGLYVKVSSFVDWINKEMIRML